MQSFNGLKEKRTDFDYVHTGRLDDWSMCGIHDGELELLFCRLAMKAPVLRA